MSNILNPDCNLAETVKYLEESGARLYSLSFASEGIYELIKYLNESISECDKRLGYDLSAIVDMFKEFNNSNTIHGITISFGKAGSRELFFKVHSINREMKDEELYDIEKAMVEKMWFLYISRTIKTASEMHEVYTNSNILFDEPELNDSNVKFRVWYDKE